LTIRRCATGEFDDVAIVGVVEPELAGAAAAEHLLPRHRCSNRWDGAPKKIGARRRGPVLDLLTCASRRTIVSTFTLDEDALVSRSMQLDEIPRARLSTVARTPFTEARIFADEALSLEPIALDPLTEKRASGRASHEPIAGGRSGVSRQRARSARARLVVSAIETISMPVQVLAQHVLKLEEEPEDER